MGVLGKRNEAKLLGEKYYDSGKPCVHGHRSLKRVDNGRCLECLEELRQTPESKKYHADYHKNNWDKILPVKRAYAQLHKEEINEYLRNYRKENLGAVTTREKRYKQSDKGKLSSKLNANKRRARIIGTTADPLTALDVKDILDYYDNKCIYCGGKYEDLDHIVPLSKGGTHTKDNLAPACKDCNRNGGKGAKILFEEWLPPNYISLVEGVLNEQDIRGQ